MANIQELKSVLKETLENRGVLGQMRARMRAEVFHSLDDQLETPPTLSNENMLINELIREYFEFNHYKYSLSVMLAESGQPKTPLDRSFLTKELNIQEENEASRLPLLYSILSHFLEGNSSSGLPARPRQFKDSRRVNSTRSARSDRRFTDSDFSGDMHLGEPVVFSGTKGN